MSRLVFNGDLVKDTLGTLEDLSLLLSRYASLTQKGLPYNVLNCAGIFCIDLNGYTMIEALRIFGDLVEAEEGFAGKELAGSIDGTLFGFL